MRKYKFRNIVIICDWLFVIAFVVAFFLIDKFIPGSKETSISGRIVVIAVIVFEIPMLFSHTKRHLFIDDECIRFKSFHIDKKYRDWDVPFSSIQSIAKVFYPNLKMFSLSIKTDQFEKAILIDATISEHKELFSEICKRAKHENPSVVIDNKLIDYLDQSGDGSLIDKD